MAAPDKYEVGVVARVDGTGKRHSEGSYVMLLFENDNNQRVELLISEGAACVLAAELERVVPPEPSTPTTKKKED